MLIKNDKITPTNKYFKKDLAFITRVTNSLARLEKKYAIPLEKRKAAMFTRNLCNVLPPVCSRARTCDCS